MVCKPEIDDRVAPQHDRQPILNIQLEWHKKPLIENLNYILPLRSLFGGFSLDFFSSFLCLLMFGN
jgi:hypothetical protein